MSVKHPVAASPLFTRLWLAWIGAFFAIEGTALARRRPEDTLSDHVWVWFDIPVHPAPARAVRGRRILLVGFLSWLSGHFLTGDDV